MSQVVTFVTAAALFLVMPTISIGLFDPMEVESDIPEPYYFDEGYVEPTLGNLDDVVSEIVYPHEYEAGVYDCSERSAYVERYLENRGFDADIVTSDKEKHAWVLVRDVKCTVTYGPGTNIGAGDEIIRTIWLFDDFELSPYLLNTVKTTEYMNIFVESGQFNPSVVNPNVIGSYDIDYNRYVNRYEDIYDATWDGTFTTSFDWWVVNRIVESHGFSRGL